MFTWLFGEVSWMLLFPIIIDLVNSVVNTSSSVIKFKYSTVIAGHRRKPDTDLSRKI